MGGDDGDHPSTVRPGEPCGGLPLSRRAKVPQPEQKHKANLTAQAGPVIRISYLDIPSRRSCSSYLYSKNKPSAH